MPFCGNVSPFRPGEIVTRSLAVAYCTVAYDESGQMMSAAAVPAKHATSAATTNVFLNICDTSKRTFQRSSRDGIRIEAFAEVQGSPRTSLGFAWVET